MNASPRVTTPFAPDSSAREVIDGVDLAGRRAVVTGGTSGIGAETVRALALAGAEVTVATRRPETAGLLVSELSGVSGAGPVRAQALELSDLSSVRNFAKEWQGPLDILVANAGIMALPQRVTSAEGWEMQLATNYLGHFALASALLPSMQASGSARIVIVSSGAHRAFPLDLADPQFEQRPYDPWAAYGQSKSADVLLAVGARRWWSDGITANAVNPGYVLTNLQRHLDDDTMRSFGVMDDDGKVKPLPYYKTPSQGAAGSVLLAGSPLLAGVTGRYFEDNQEAVLVSGDKGEASGVAAHAVDPEVADRLWDYATDAISQ
ncbi:SDR family NAD(P)-dependent oxidoreductase [Streptomyces canus]|uniref:Probable oxidoreductase n=1 Tax=Streptomyces canus TaxID=58343 RepID=A0AAW8F6W3_9ACTN|nr:SDR family NAD(P)-dependent oxidoreductase [Streptomyces canus]MDQ0767095.1 NAD(P)-dependent dehydrogenase (short-subunit alcohol dehydrogenase family) [Streptomyces canus]MDQ0904865.1 NAD(P)-dependent dehydrogenase (short-subunit alcohol dehydrogenase family) [Streptomyces canus]MDQ1065132.1 NAD(P)-dependent dehydrogenase (short-subunit alcohol dehydrogenase family) [Streptomyces canus]